MLLCSSLCCCFISASQDTNDVKVLKNKASVYADHLRGQNALTLGVGTSVMNGDYQDPLFEIYSHYGYKRYFCKYLNISLTYHKFNLAYDNVLNEGFMSFDLNIEYILLPNKLLTPFIFGGGGYHAENYFEQTDLKVQAGAGIEYLFTDQFGVKLQMDYNHVFSDEVEGLVKGASDDVYWRVAFGVHIYFGKWNKKRRLKPNEPTVINSNPIIHN